MFCVGAAESDAVPDIMPVMAAAFDPTYGEAWTEIQCRGALALPGSWMLTARHDGRTVGFAIVRTVLDEAELMLIGVDPDCQHSGVGQALLSAVFERCRTLSVEKIHVEMREDNPARRFYINAGFTVAGQRRNYYHRLDGKSADAITFCRLLTN